MEEGKAKKRPLDLDWNKLLPIHDDGPPSPMLVINPSTETIDSVAEPGQTSYMECDPPAEDLQHLNDHQLTESIQSKIHTLETTAGKLRDKGEKLRATIKRYEDELGRRKLRRLEKNRKLMRVRSPQKLQTQVLLIDCGTVNASKKDLSLLKHCDNQKMRDNGNFSQKGRKGDQSSLRQVPFQCPSNLSKCNTSNNDKRRRATSTRSLHNIENLSGCFPKMKDACQIIQLDDLRSRKGQAIVLDDEDETPILEKTCQKDKLAECLKEAKIYYPSSDDPKCVEICYTDIDCLSPGSFLTSTIMNFYIRYLQQQASLTNRSISDYHFFNTYFYKKLKEAVSYKRSDRDTFFAKFRRWWKGTNIFQKAYVLIPIHEDLHWSLVIISFPEKKDESGPIILHLDSLGLHSSRSVFENIKSYLKEEWKYVDQECVSSDIPIADKIWKNLSRRIEDKILKKTLNDSFKRKLDQLSDLQHGFQNPRDFVSIGQLHLHFQLIEVPQQKNDYDCGLFVLYFIERFIEEAPERLKKKDLNMFGNKWFKPEEASSLRVKIRDLLKEEFQNSCKPMSSVVTSPECVETAKDS